MLKDISGAVSNSVLIPSQDSFIYFLKTFIYVLIDRVGRRRRGRRRGRHTQTHMLLFSFGERFLWKPGEATPTARIVVDRGPGASCRC